jgi:hypothetical protein
MSIGLGGRLNILRRSPLDLLNPPSLEATTENSTMMFLEVLWLWA